MIPENFFHNSYKDKGFGSKLTQNIQMCPKGPKHNTHSTERTLGLLYCAKSTAHITNLYIVISMLTCDLRDEQEGKGYNLIK